MIIALGGAEELLHMKEGTLDLVLLKRKGFVKIALKTGCDLVPIIGFGENELFTNMRHPNLEPIQRFIKKTVRASAPFVIGKSWGILPARYPLVTVGI